MGKRRGVAGWLAGRIPSPTTIPQSPLTHSRSSTHARTTQQTRQTHPQRTQAIVENLDVKIPFYKNLGSLVKPQAIFGSNTSSLKIADFARPSGRPEKFVSRWLVWSGR